MADAITKPFADQTEAEKKETYREWASRYYNEQYESWMPWMEDQYLKWFGKDNKASYATKDALGKTKVTGVDQVDHLQDGVNDLVGGQVGKGGLLQPVGDLAGKEGINRIERSGKDEKGTYGGAAAGITDPAIQNAQKAGSSVTQGAKGGASYVTESAKGAGGYLGGFLGGKKEEKK